MANNHHPIKNFDDLVSTETAAELLGLKKGTLDRWRQTGLEDLPFYKIGRLVMYSKQDLLEYINSRLFHHTKERTHH